MTHTYHIIANLQAGDGSGKKVTEIVLASLEKKKINVHIHQTKYKQHAKSLVREVLPQMEEQDRLLVIGGDGTLHEVVNGMLKGSVHRPIGYIPAGTGNDFARSRKISNRTNVVLKEILRATSPTRVECLQSIDANPGTIRYGLNSIGFGFDGTVIAARLNQPTEEGILSRLLPSSVYVQALIKAYKNRSPLSVRTVVDGVERKFEDVLFVDVMNHPYFGGGIKVDPETKSNSDNCTLVVVKNLPFSQLLKLLPLVFTNGRHVHSPYYHRFPGQSFQIQLEDEAYGQVDGELIEKEIRHITVSMSQFEMWNR